MKKFLLMMTLAFISPLLQMRSTAQTVYPKKIMPYSIMVGYDKTSNLIFPYAIRSVERGSPGVLAQIAPGIENILQLKAARKNFPQTDLTVITADGKFYSFLVDYAVNPPTLNLSFEKDRPQAKLKDYPTDASTFYKRARLIKTMQGFLHVCHREGKIKLRLQSLYLEDDMMYFCFSLTNKSAARFIPESIRFFIRERKQPRRTAIQEVELSPVYRDSSALAETGQFNTFVFAFRPFDLPESKEMVLRLRGRAGWRALALKIKPATLGKVRRLTVSGQPAYEDPLRPIAGR